MNSNRAIAACVAVVGGLSFALSVFASTTYYSETFETNALASIPGDWSGNCFVTNSDTAYAKADVPGYPIRDVTHTNVLAVQGSVSRNYGDEGDRVVDFLFKVDDLPDDELPNSDGTEAFKMAVNTNGHFVIYHARTADATAAQWSEISSAVYAPDTWVRVTCTFRYPEATGRALVQVKLDGSPVVSEYGFRSPDELVSPGSWYYSANTTTSLAQMNFVGCGAVDDVVNGAESAYTPPVGDNDHTQTNGVDFTWLNEQGLAWDDPATTKVPGSTAEDAYTVKEAFDAGTDPYSANKLYTTNATYDAEHLVLTINGYGRTYQVETNALPFTDGTKGVVISTADQFTSNKTDNTTTWTGPLPTGHLTYYRIRSSSASTAETVNQFAIMQVQSTAANTLISLPWKSLGPSPSDPASITAANVVMTNGLMAEDWLIYYDNDTTGFRGWKLDKTGWMLASIVDLNGVDVSEAAADASLARGQAVWLIRRSEEVNPTRDLTTPIYLYGQYYDEAGETVVKTNLVANPVATNDFDLAANKIIGAKPGDVIQVPAAAPDTLPTRYEYRNNAWGYVKEGIDTIGDRKVKTQTWTTEGEGMKIPAGRGFYIATTNDTGVTIKW